MSQARKRNRKDKRHGWYLSNLDSLHVLMPYVMPGRTQNEAVLGEDLDITKLEAYIDLKNKENPDFKYTRFQAVCAALAKVLILRPKMNYYISSYRMYEHKEITLAFVVKRQFNDNGAEHLAKISIDREGASPMSQVYEKVRKIVTCVRRTDESKGITKKLDFYHILPRPLLLMLFWFLRLMEYFGDSPESLKKDDPYYSSIFVTNLGSIKLDAEYHHLSEWGDNSFFVVIGEKKKGPIFNDDGSYEMHNTIHISMTIDERIADGYYFSKSFKLFRHLIQNPDLLDLPAEAEINLE